MNFCLLEEKLRLLKIYKKIYFSLICNNPILFIKLTMIIGTHTDISGEILLDLPKATDKSFI